MSIRILAPEVASQIAAGEVVERPASVVKELVENALDAGGRAVTVTIREAGRSLIEVADDGNGIPAGELSLAVERHATSKLQNANDLFSIGTLGFRGEALASIGSVSRMTITSRMAADPAGARIRVEAGIAGVVEPVGAPQGTVVRVEDLFYNVPARLKFLKQDVTERRAIDGLLSRYALAYPQIRLRFISDSTPVLQTSGDGDRRAILASLYGVDVAKQMLEVLAEEEGLRLTGYISPASLTRSNRKEITFFINGRWISDTPLSQAIMQAYHTLLMVGRFPLTALFLEVDPAEVDVNVHPAKAEVRFRNQERIFSFIQRSARRALLAYSPIPSMPPAQNLWSGGQSSGFSGQFSGGSQQGIGLEWGIAHDNLNAEGRVQSDQAGTVPQGDIQHSAFSNLPLLRLVGQIGASYLVAEGPDGLYLIDQHAAHERILFEKLMNQRAHQNIPSQALLTPEVVHLPPASTNLIQEQLPVLQKFGFEIEPFGPGTFQVRAMPTLFSGSDPSAALRALVEDFEEDETPLQSELEAKIAGRVCKRLAVKAGQALSPEEQRALIENLEACESPRTCPHGRPTMIHLSVDVLERQFGRRGAR
ncbi:MAG: DNA mismatch repair protein MutL [Chloroflexi bacterium HGW-Chloroflexi-6]|nr:MAG: DNA mismatch repair protein MutL [Chloroflexi bacterium HGW-Chloroflexi-6]